MGGFIFLPYSFDDEKAILRSFQDFLAASATHYQLPTLAVRNHPVMQDSRAHARLKDRIEGLMRAHSDRFSAAQSGSRLSVFIGATASILEALERGVEVVQICSNPLLESHSVAIWQGLCVERVSERVFRYRLSTPGTYIELGKEGSSNEADLGPRPST